MANHACLDGMPLTRAASSSGSCRCTHSKELSDRTSTLNNRLPITGNLHDSTVFSARIQALTALEKSGIKRPGSPCVASLSCGHYSPCTPSEVVVAESFDAARRRRFPESRRVWLPQNRDPGYRHVYRPQPTVVACPPNTTTRASPLIPQSGSQPLTAV